MPSTLEVTRDNYHAPPGWGATPNAPRPSEPPWWSTARAKATVRGAVGRRSEYPDSNGARVVSASKFTRQTRGALIERFAAGVSTEDAARALGLRPSTVKDWLTRGRREGSGDHAEFAVEVDRVRAEAAERPEAMNADELPRVVSEAARKRSVAAMKLRHEQLRAADELDEPPSDEFDQLKELRRRRAE